MTGNFVEDSKLWILKEFFRSWRFWRPFLAVFIGGLAGFLYYYFVGCTSGSCVITSNPYMSTTWVDCWDFLLYQAPVAGEDVEKGYMS